MIHTVLGQESEHSPLSEDKQYRGPFYSAFDLELYTEPYQPESVAPLAGSWAENLMKNGTLFMASATPHVLLLVVQLFLHI